MTYYILDLLITTIIIIIIIIIVITRQALSALGTSHNKENATICNVKLEY